MDSLWRGKGNFSIEMKGAYATEEWGEKPSMTLHLPEGKFSDDL